MFKRLAVQCLCPRGEPQPRLTPTSPGDSPRPAGRSGPGAYQITAFALGLGACEILCASFKCEVSISLSLAGLLQSSPTGLCSCAELPG